MYYISTLPLHFIFDIYLDLILCCVIVTSVRSQNDNDVLSQLTALRQQLRNEEQKVQSQIGQANAVVSYSVRPPCSVTLKYITSECVLL